MNIYKKLLAVLFFSLIILNIISENDINIKNKVCIIYIKTKYKQEIAKELENKLKEKDLIVKKDLIRNIKKYNPDDYDVFIILSGVKIFTPNPMVTIFIKKYNYNKNIIYFCSTEYKESAYGFLDQDKIDVITSASEKSNKNKIVNEIIEKMNNILNHK